MWNKELILQEFQKHGKRITQQRLVLLDVIFDTEWTNCKEVYYEASKIDSTIGISTVYRMFATLEEIGVLNHGYQYSVPDRVEVK